MSLLVEHGALYPALQRLEAQGWISAEWGVSSNNRKARFYKLTKTGRKQLAVETSSWRSSPQRSGTCWVRRRREAICSDGASTATFRLRPIFI